MRHIYTNRAVVLIAAFLLGAAVLFAELRSRPPMTAPMTTGPAENVQADDPLAASRRLYATACASCHASRETGRTVPTRLQRTAQKLAIDADGWDYLGNLLLFGASGTYVNEEGKQRRLSHPAYGRYTDEELAGVINLLLSDGGRSPEIAEYSAEEIASLREGALSPEEVIQGRPAKQ